LRSTKVKNIKNAIFEIFREILPHINNNADSSAIARWKQDPSVLTCYEKLYELSNPENEDSDTYMTLIVKRTWPKKKNISELYLTWAATIAEIILDPSNGHITLREHIVQPLLEKNLVSVNN